MPDSNKVCALCGQPQQARFAPFCSKRCADLDLGRWLKGGYVIPGPAAEEQSAPPDDQNDED